MSDENPIRRPQTFDEVMKDLEMTPEEEADLERAKYEAAAPEKKKDDKQGDALDRKADDPGDPDSIPEWVTFPPNFKIPPGKTLGFIRFYGRWTERPEKGDRVCIVWPLSDADEKLAYKRTRGETARSLAELTKQMVRAIDGEKVTWSGNPQDGAIVDRFWEDIGPRCRQMLQTYYLKTHSFSQEDQAEFFLHCLVSRTARTAG